MSYPLTSTTAKMAWGDYSDTDDDLNDSKHNDDDDDDDYDDDGNHDDGNDYVAQFTRRAPTRLPTRFPTPTQTRFPTPTQTRPPATGLQAPTIPRDQLKIPSMVANEWTAVRRHTSTQQHARLMPAQAASEPRDECFARRASLVCSFLEKHSMSLLSEVHAWLHAHEVSIRHRFLPSVQSVHISLFLLMKEGKVTSHIQPGTVRWSISALAGS